MPRLDLSKHGRRCHRLLDRCGSVVTLPSKSTAGSVELSTRRLTVAPRAGATATTTAASATVVAIASSRRLTRR